MKINIMISKSDANDIVDIFDHYIELLREKDFCQNVNKKHFEKMINKLRILKAINCEDDVDIDLIPNDDDNNVQIEDVQEGSLNRGFV